MWIQEGNSRRWALYQDDHLVYGFTWRRVRKNEYLISWGVYEEAEQGPWGLTPNWRTYLHGGWLGYSPPRLTKEEKDAKWETLMAHPVSFIMLQIAL